MDDYTIKSLEQYLSLLTDIHSSEGTSRWDHIIPYYDEEIYFRDTVQEIRGLDHFVAMTQRLSKRSKNLEMVIKNSSMQNNVIFVEWEMTISYKKNPSSVLYGSSRLTLTEDGKIIEQRDYYDLWGDIFDNIPRFGKAYRKFMRRKFG